MMIFVYTKAVTVGWREGQATAGPFKTLGKTTQPKHKGLAYFPPI